MRTRTATGGLLAAALVAGLTLAASAFDGGLRTGGAFTLDSLDRWLALAGVGCCIGSLDRRSRVGAWTAIAAGALASVVSRHSLLWDWIAQTQNFPYAHFMAPAACFLTGLMLVLKGRWRARTAPVIGFLVSGALSLTVVINDPAPEHPGFVIGAALAALALILFAAGLRRLADAGWLAIGERIAGSWLLTIGLLLISLQLAPTPGLIDAVAQGAPGGPSSTVTFEPTMGTRPSDDPASFERHGLQQGTN